MYSVHILALDALLAVVQSVEGHCHAQLLNTMEKAIEDNIPVEKTKKSGDNKQTNKQTKGHAGRQAGRQKKKQTNS